MQHKEKNVNDYVAEVYNCYKDILPSIGKLITEKKYLCYTMLDYDDKIWYIIDTQQQMSYDKNEYLEQCKQSLNEAINYGLFNKNISKC